jgi:ion channel-forming bestrophin family protein
MFVKRNIPWSIIFRFAKKNLVIFFTIAIFWTWLLYFLNSKGCAFRIPMAPVSVLGVAVSFYLGFKNNQSYDRFWEARTSWGGIVNVSRHFSAILKSYLSVSGALPTQHAELYKVIVYRHLAYINALRLNLRKPSSFSVEYRGSIKEFSHQKTQAQDWLAEVAPFLSDAEFESLSTVQNMPTQLLKNQSLAIQTLKQDESVTEFEHIDLLACIKDFYTEQGRCERIKNTPFPRQYAYFSKVFVWIFIGILPLSLASEFININPNLLWVTIPFSVVISWVFLTIEIVGDNSEDPFENFINDVPMTAICRTIEIDLKEMIGEANIPSRIMPENNVLM